MSNKILKRIEEFASHHPQNLVYEHPLPGVRLLHKLRVKKILFYSMLIKPQRILDVGCGEGYVLLKVHELLPNIFPVGLDVSITRLIRAKRKCKGCDLIRASASALPCRKKAFEASICSELIEHVQNDKKVMKEIARCTKWLILTTPNYLTLENSFWMKVGRIPGYGASDHVREYTYDSLMCLLKTSGFIIKQFDTLGFYLPFKHLIWRSKILTKLLFLFSKIFKKKSRIFIVLAQNKV